MSLHRQGNKITTCDHCCPVNGRVAALKATDSASLGAKRGVRDLNSEHSLEIFQGGSREHRQDAFCSIDGVSAVEDIRPDRCAVWRRRPGADAELWRAIPGHGVCPTDLPGEFAGYRDVPFRSGVEALPHGLARTDSALDAGRCQRIARLAHLRGSGPAVDRPGEEAVRHGGSWSGPDQYGLRLGFDNHRPVPVGLSVGSFPHHQGGGEDAHPARFARQHPDSFIHVSDGKLADVHALDLLLPEAGAIYVMDRGYVDFARLHALHQAGAFFVTRTKSNMNAHRVYSAPTDRTTGIICDQTIALDGHYTSQHYPEQLRRVRFRDAVSGKTLVFLSNHFALPALTIAALYKNRWQVELFFKWIKQHLRIKQFYGTSENAVKTQI